MAPRTELDIRTLPAPSRHAAVLARFDALAVDEEFVLVCDHEAKPMLVALQDGRAGRFDWHVVERSPERHRVVVRRRIGEGPRAVVEFLEGDHRRLDALLEQAESAASGDGLAEARAAFDEFAAGLEHHIDMEERVLFVAFDALTGMAGGPTRVMREEHRGIRTSIADTQLALARGDAAAAVDEMRGLAQRLAMHNMKEERIIYPETDRGSSSPERRDALVRRMQLV